MAKTKTKRKTQEAKKRPSRTMEEIVENAAREAAEEAVNENEGFETEENESENPSFFSFGGESTDLQDDDIDIFAWGDEYARKHGRPVRFWIKKNSEMMGPKDRPYSWEKLMKDFGPGLYHVTCREKLGGKIVKAVTETVGDPMEGRHVEDDHVESQQIPQAPAPSFMELFALTNKVQEQSELKAQSLAAVQSQAMSTMMTAMIQSQQQSSQQFQMMMLELQKEARASQDRMMTLMTTLMTAKPSDDGKKAIDSLQLIKMLSDARKEGKDEQKYFMEILEKKVEQAKEEAEANASTGEENESTIKTIVKSFVPILGQALAQGQAAQGLPEPQLTPEQQRELQIRRKNEELIEQRRKQAELQTLAMQRTQRPVTPTATPSVYQGQPQIHTVKDPNQNGKGLDLGKIKVNDPTIRESKVSENTQAMRQKIMRVVEGDITQGLFLSTDPSKTAAACLTKLEKNAISRQDVLNALPLDYLLDQAKAGGIPEAKFGWIKELYAAIEKTEAKPPKPRRDAGDVTKTLSN